MDRLYKVRLLVEAEPEGVTQRIGKEYLERINI